MKNTLPYLTVLALLAVFALPALAPRASAQDSPNKPAESKPAKFKIVVHESNPTTELSRREVSRIFYKRISRWEDWGDGTIIPIDRERDSEVRKVFSKTVHKKSAWAMETYWQHMIFSGTESPPKTRVSDEEVLQFIRENDRAVGYVSGDLTLEDGVKELKIRN